MEITKPTHTPGPWGCIDTSYHAHDYRLTKPDGTFLPVNAPSNDHSEQRANARLISAAPDLLAALKAVRRLGGETPDEQDRIIAQAEAAIAKAEGGR